MKVADIREPVIVPRAGVCKGYRAHVAEPNYWPSAQEEYERGIAGEQSTVWRGSFWLAMALIAVAAILGTVGVVLWPR